MLPISQASIPRADPTWHPDITLASHLVLIIKIKCQTEISQNLTLTASHDPIPMKPLFSSSLDVVRAKRERFQGLEWTVSLEGHHLTLGLNLWRKFENWKSDYRYYWQKDSKEDKEIAKQHSWLLSKIKETSNETYQRVWNLLLSASKLCYLSGYFYSIFK